MCVNCPALTKKQQSEEADSQSALAHTGPCFDLWSKKLLIEMFADYFNWAMTHEYLSLSLVFLTMFLSFVKAALGLRCQIHPSEQVTQSSIGFWNRIFSHNKQRENLPE